MRLDEYARLHGRGSIPELARKAGVHNSRLYEILRGHVPTVKLAKRIADASDGAITAAELVGLDTASTIATNEVGASTDREGSAAAE